MVVQPGPVVDFLLANQNVKDPYSVDWNKVHRPLHLCYWISTDEKYLSGFLSYQARRVLKNLRVKVAPSNREYKISGLSESRCKEQMYVSVYFCITCWSRFEMFLTGLSLVDTGSLGIPRTIWAKLWSIRRLCLSISPSSVTSNCSTLVTSLASTLASQSALLTSPLR